jgi:hypothetical protein
MTSFYQAPNSQNEILALLPLLEESFKESYR